MSEWRFFATQLHGDGTETSIIQDLPLQSPQVTTVLSGAGSITGSITPEISGLKDIKGMPLLKPWSTAIYAEKDRQIVQGGILQPGTLAQGPTLQIEAAGFSAYPQGMPYDDEIYFVEKDALDIYRHIWDHLQAQERGNIGMVLDQTKAGVLVGEELEEVTFETGEGEEVFFEAGPFKLSWYATDNLADRLDELVDLGGFEYREQHTYRSDGGITHRLRFGVPRLGRRRKDLHFMAGDNLIAEPSFTAGTYASEVWAFGAGEGRLVKFGRASRSGEKRLRRIVTATDKQMHSHKRARELAAKVLPRNTGVPQITNVTIDGGSAGRDLPDLGDEVLVELNGQGWHGTGRTWVRVVAMTQTPATPFVSCEVEPVDGIVEG